MRGRKPKATATKEASGAFRKNPQRKNKAEPLPKRGWPVKPPHIAECEIASPQWDGLCKTLDEMNILTVADQSLLALYCQTYAEWMKLQRHVKEHGCSIMNDKGNVSQSPEAVQVHRYADRLLKMMAELGLTPSSRSRIKVPEQSDDDDPFTELLSRIGRG
jgi:P27 family predicted phage terminase small subunit